MIPTVHMRAGDVEVGDAVLGAMHFPHQDPHPRLVKKVSWHGSSRTHRRIEFFTDNIVISKDALLLVQREL